MRAAIGIGCVLAMALVDSAPVRGSRERAGGLVAARGDRIGASGRASGVPAQRFHAAGDDSPVRCPAVFVRCCSGSAKDDIGIARIVWRRGDGAASGIRASSWHRSRQAPRSLNRWGYIAEDIEGADGSILALMTGADEATLQRGGFQFQPAAEVRAIFVRSGACRGGAATWQTARVSTPSL